MTYSGLVCEKPNLLLVQYLSMRMDLPLLKKMLMLCGL